MSKQSKLNKSWERYASDIHSPLGVAELRQSIRYALKKHYAGLAESMFRLEMSDADKERMKDMLQMSRDTVPEVFLLRNGECVFFETGGQLHCLPVVYDGGVNIYGKMSRWHPLPVGYVDGQNAVFDSIRHMDLDDTNSVIMRNDLFGGNDEGMIDSMVSELVDNILTLNQLQLLAKSPFVFRVSEDNLLSAKEFFLALSTDRPAIFTNSFGEEVAPIVEETYHPIDPTLIELFDRWESILLGYLGYDVVPITKRAQQSVAEISSAGNVTYMKRMEKLHQREQAWDRINAMFGTSVKVISTIDEFNDLRDEIPETDGTMEGNENALKEDEKNVL